MPSRHKILMFTFLSTSQEISWERLQYDLFSVDFDFINIMLADTLPENWMKSAPFCNLMSSGSLTCHYVANLSVNERLTVELIMHRPSWWSCASVTRDSLLDATMAADDAGDDET